MIGRLKEFVDGLESITKSLGLLEAQHERLRQEIESISDTESLRLLRDASSRHGSSSLDVSDTASHWLISVVESTSQTRTFQSVPLSRETAESFVTAKSKLSMAADTLNTVPVHGSPTQPSHAREGIKAHQPLSFVKGDLNYGTRLSTVKAEDEKRWNKKSITYLTQASNGSSAAKRMFFELRNIKEGRVPFVSGTPVGDSLTRILASIEGPPETPYEGGIFWITISLPDNNPQAPVLIRFHTKIYHPNLSPRGEICGDYRENWDAVLCGEKHKTHAGSWFQRKTSSAQWTLGALLTAMCGLLASPDVDEPLVPKIAQKYLEDYSGYFENAKLYTERFARTSRPAED